MKNFTKAANRCRSHHRVTLRTENGLVSQRLVDINHLHTLLKGGYTGHEKTYSGDVNISPGLPKTKQNQFFFNNWASGGNHALSTTLNFNPSMGIFSVTRRSRSDGSH